MIFDALGKMFTGIPKSNFEKALRPGGRFVSAEMDRKDRVEDLILLGELIGAGKVRPVIDRCYRLEQVAEAHRYVEQKHKKGNVVITLVSGHSAHSP